MTKTLTAVTITDRNDWKFIVALRFIDTNTHQNCNTIEAKFEATAELHEARRAYSLNAPVPVQSFIAASRAVDKAIYDFKRGGHNG